MRKSNNNSYHASTSASFDIFFEKDPHLNAAEFIVNRAFFMLKY